MTNNNNLYALCFDALKSELTIKDVHEKEAQLAELLDVKRLDHLKIDTISIEGQNFYIVYYDYPSVPSSLRNVVNKNGKRYVSGNFIITRKEYNRPHSLYEGDIELILSAFSPKIMDKLDNSVIKLSDESVLNVSDENINQFYIRLTNKDGSVLYN